jgi:hypothetical protein
MSIEEVLADYPDLERGDERTAAHVTSACCDRFSYRAIHRSSVGMLGRRRGR